MTNIIFSNVKEIEGYEFDNFLSSQFKSGNKSQKSPSPETCLTIINQAAGAIKQLGDDLNKNRFQEIAVTALPILDSNWDKHFYEVLIGKLFATQGVSLKHIPPKGSILTTQYVYKCAPIDPDKSNSLSNFLYELIKAKREKNESLFKSCQSHYSLYEDEFEKLDFSTKLKTFHFDELKILKEQIRQIKNNSHLISQIDKIALRAISNKPKFLPDIQDLDEEGLRFLQTVIESNQTHKILDQKMSANLSEEINKKLELYEFGPFVNSGSTEEINEKLELYEFGPFVNSGSTEKINEKLEPYEWRFR